MPFPYTMRTTNVMEHSRGVAWTADLLHEGAPIGVIEQDGNGGADWVSIPDTEARRRWERDVEAAFGTGAYAVEDATLYLLEKEYALT